MKGPRGQPAPGPCKKTPKTRKKNRFGNIRLSWYVTNANVHWTCRFGLASTWSSSFFHVSAQDIVLRMLSATFDFGQVSGPMSTQFLFGGGGLRTVANPARMLALTWSNAWWWNTTPWWGEGEPGRGARLRVLRQQVRRLGWRHHHPSIRSWMYENVFLACQRGFRAHLVFKVLQLHSFIASFTHVFCSIPAKHAAWKKGYPLLPPFCSGREVSG